MAIAALIPVELYLRTGDYEPDAEYVDGEIELRPIGQYDHAAWQSALQKWFWKHEEAWNVLAMPELRVQVSPTRYRVPDVTLVANPRAGAHLLTHPPIAGLEVLSPEATIGRMLIKLRDYEAMGIQAIVVVNPKDRSLYRFTGGNLEQMEPGVQQLGLGPCQIDWQAVLDSVARH